MPNVAELIKGHVGPEASRRLARAIADKGLGLLSLEAEAQAGGYGRLSAEAENLVRVLADNRRLEVLPEIASQYEVLRNERQGVVEAEILSALPLQDSQLESLVARLEAHTGKRVKPQVSVDQELIAGVRVLIGDKVIDGSVRAQLQALEAALKQ